MESNHFDDIQGEYFQTEHEETAIGQRLDYLIHKVFSQSDDGMELLEHWTSALIMTPTVVPGADQFLAGINEGKKEFIRNILLTIERVGNE